MPRWHRAHKHAFNFCTTHNVCTLHDTRIIFITISGICYTSFRKREWASRATWLQQTTPLRHVQQTMCVCVCVRCKRSTNPCFVHPIIRDDWAQRVARIWRIAIHRIYSICLLLKTYFSMLRAWYAGTLRVAGAGVLESVRKKPNVSIVWIKQILHYLDIYLCVKNMRILRKKLLTHKRNVLQHLPVDSFR